MNDLRDTLLNKLRTLRDDDNLDTYDNDELPDLIGDDLIERLDDLPQDEQDRLLDDLRLTLIRDCPNDDNRLRRCVRLSTALDRALDDFS